MELAIYNRSNTKANLLAEAVYLRVAMMYANDVYTSSFMSEILVKWHLRHKIPDHYLCRLHDLFYPEEIEEGQSNFKDWFSTLKELRKIKHKDKAMIVIHQKMENLMKLVKQDVFDYYERFIDLHKLHAPLKFYEVGMIAYVKNKVKDGDECDAFGLTLMNSEDYSEDDKEEDPLLKHIIDGFIEYEQSLVFDWRVSNKKIYVDGNNVAFENFRHRENKNGDDKPHCSNIKLVVDELRNLRFEEIIVIGDPGLKRRAADVAVLTKMITDKQIIFQEAPSRTEADEFFIKKAKNDKCSIITNDTFRDWKLKDIWIAENIDRIRIPFMIEGGKVTFSGIEKLFHDSIG